MSDTDQAPKMGLGDVSSSLEDVAITTWDVDPALLADLLPGGLEPDRYRLDDGRERAFVSAVSFLNRDFFMGMAPFVKIVARQTNYRAYVRRGDERAVWFFGTSLGSLVLVPRHVWGLPWARSRGEHTASWSEAGLDHLSWQVESELGTESLELVGSGQPMGRLDGFEDEAQTQRVLTHPTIGYVSRRGRDVVSYSVWHRPFALERARADHARFSKYEELGLVAPEQPPHSALVQQQIHYLIFLPPHHVPELG
jgi:Uncharacterized conserved protein (COG2071)